MKQVIVVREDLKMSIGKICSQVAHASLFSALKCKKKHPILFSKWIREGAKKIVVRAKDLEELKKLKVEADRMKIPNELIRDAGYTEIKPGTITSLGIGPAKEEEIDRITGNLKLL